MSPHTEAARSNPTQQDRENTEPSEIQENVSLTPATPSSTQTTVTEAGLTDSRVPNYKMTSSRVLRKIFGTLLSATSTSIPTSVSLQCIQPISSQWCYADSFYSDIFHSLYISTTCQFFTTATWKHPTFYPYKCCIIPSTVSYCSTIVFTLSTDTTTSPASPSRPSSESSPPIQFAA